MLETGREEAASPMGPQYYFEHSLRVAFWCWRLALEMHTDVSTCVAAGLLHDVSRFESEKLVEVQATIAAEAARRFMEKEGFKKEFIDTVAYVIENQAQEGGPKTLETKILQDASKIDEFGYFRLLLFAKTVAESFSEMEKSVNSLLEKVVNLEKGEYGQMWTSIGKTRMVTQIALYKGFLRGLLEEIENTRTTMR